jgi:hypothetical protein
MNIKNKIFLNSFVLVLVLLIILGLILMFPYIIETKIQLIIICGLCLLLCTGLYIIFKIFLAIMIWKELNKKGKVERNFRLIPPKRR